MTDVPVQTFLIGCREDSLASHRHIPKNAYNNLKKNNKNFVIKKKKAHTHVINLCYGATHTYAHTYTHKHARYKTMLYS